MTKCSWETIHIKNCRLKDTCARYTEYKGVSNQDYYLMAPYAWKRLADDHFDFKCECFEEVKND